MAKRSAKKKSQKQKATRASGRTRSFQCPDDLWSEVEKLARERDLGAPAAAARLLLRSGLAIERKTRELDTARAWQIEQAWADVQAISGGDRVFGSWSQIDEATERARLRLRARAAVHP